MSETMYTTAEAAALLGLSHNTVRSQVRRGVLQATRIGARTVLISADEVERYRTEHLG
jgi:excisionase family DNA binding protein